jgi:signal transduction histidine kinase
MTPVRAPEHAAFRVTAAITAAFAPVSSAMAADASVLVGESGFWLAIAVAALALGATLHMYRRVRSAEARAAANEAEVTRARTLLDGSGRHADGLGRLLDALPLPVWRRRPDLALDYANRTYVEAVEHKGGIESMPEIGSGVIATDGRALTIAAQSAGASQTAEHHIVMGGARRRLAVTEAPLEGGGLAGYALDRTEVEDVKADLSRHIAGHEEVLHNLGTAVAIYGSDKRLLFFNNAFLKLWKLDEDWLRNSPSMGEVLEELRARRRLPEEANFPAFKAKQLKLFTSLLQPIEGLVHLPDGTTLREVVAAHAFGGLLLTWEDVTNTLALERNYNTLIAAQRETLDNLYEGVAVVGGDGRLRLSNPAFAHIWRLPETLLANQPHFSDLVERMRGFLEDGGDWPAQKEELITLVTHRDSHSGRIERKDGVVLDFAKVPLPDGAALLSYVDVSDTIRAERALRERNDALETADRLKTEFIANVSYKLRTSLNTIIGFTEMLTGQYFGPLNERQSEYSKGILESSHRLLSLINDILDLATIEAGYMTLERDWVDLHTLLSNTLALVREPARKKNIALELDCPPEIGSINVDERRMKQALFNVLSNSVKFTAAEGSITVSARRRDDRLVLTFTDTGIGISPDDRSRVFMKFERGSSPEARRSGAGLGMPLVKSLIELHGGTVDLESEPGVGTKVTCLLPMQQAPAVAEARVSEAR